MHYRSIPSAVKELFLFALPIVVGNLGHMLIQTSDIFVAGRHSNETLAAIGIATGFIAPVFMIGLGLLVFSPILAHKRGEGKATDNYLFSTLVYALIAAIPTILLSECIPWIIPVFGFPQEVVQPVSEFLRWFSISFVFAYLFHAMKEYLQAHETVLIPNAISLISVAVNIAIAWTLTFGWGPIPPMGIRGMAISGILVRLFNVIALMIFLHKPLRRMRWTLDINYMKDVWTLGVPVSLGIFLEVAAWGGMSLLVGRMGVVQSGANNIVFNFASLTFMVPLAVSSAVAVKVGHAHGRRDIDEIRRWTTSGLILSLGFMATTGLLFSLCAHPLAGLFSPDETIIATASQLLIVVAIFQLFDGTQVTLSGVLRGLGHSRPTFWAMMAGYWFIGIPLGALLAYSFRLAALGLWIGIAIALFIAAIGLLVVLRRHLRHYRHTTAQSDRALNGRTDEGLP